MPESRAGRRWTHDHTFGQDRKRPGENRTFVVAVMTGITMVVEIAAGIAFGSMALLADGLHMGSHATALAINLLVYRFARRHAADPRFSFGTGKANALGGFAGATLLATFAALMVWESLQRLLSPTPIEFGHAITVACLGLLVNGLSVWILDANDHAHDDHACTPDDPHDHDDAGHDRDHAHGHDHNLRSAYLHVLADALTSVLAIGALLVAKYVGIPWIDPVVGLLGAALVGRWSIGLLRDTSGVLLDRQASRTLVDAVTGGIESARDGARVIDVHVWAIGPGVFAAVLVVAARQPLDPEAYRQRLPRGHGLAHVTIEVQRVDDGDGLPS